MHSVNVHQTGMSHHSQEHLPNLHLTLICISHLRSPIRPEHVYMSHMMCIYIHMFFCLVKTGLPQQRHSSSIGIWMFGVSSEHRLNCWRGIVSTVCYVRTTTKKTYKVSRVHVATNTFCARNTSIPGWKFVCNIRTKMCRVNVLEYITFLISVSGI